MEDKVFRILVGVGPPIVPNAKFLRVLKPSWSWVFRAADYILDPRLSLLCQVGDDVICPSKSAENARYASQDSFIHSFIHSLTHSLTPLLALLNRWTKDRRLCARGWVDDCSRNVPYRKKAKQGVTLLTEGTVHEMKKQKRDLGVKIKHITYTQGTWHGYCLNKQKNTTFERKIKKSKSELSRFLFFLSNNIIRLVLFHVQDKRVWIYGENSFAQYSGMRI